MLGGFSPAIPFQGRRHGILLAGFPGFCQSKQRGRGLPDTRETLYTVTMSQGANKSCGLKLTYEQQQKLIDLVEENRFLHDTTVTFPAPCWPSFVLTGTSMRIVTTSHARVIAGARNLLIERRNRV